MKKETERYIIWDWNGTLLEDTWLCVDIINEVLTRRQLPAVTVERHRELFDFPVIEYYRRLGFDMTKEPFERLGDEFMSRYEERKYECRLFADAPLLMKRLREMGIGQSLLSAYHHEYLVDILTHFDILHDFDHVLGDSNHYAAGKQEQAMFLMQQLHVDPDHVVLVGDTVHDQEVADSVGIRCRLIETGNHPREKLEKTGAPVFPDLRSAFQDIVSLETH